MNLHNHTVNVLSLNYILGHDIYVNKLEVSKLVNNAKTIQIFLPNGNPRGVKIAEVTNRTVQAILIPPE